MRRCFYQADLGQNAVFHNFAMQVALIQSGRSSTRGLLAKPLKNFPKSPIRLALTLDKRQGRLFKLRLIGLYASS